MTLTTEEVLDLAEQYSCPDRVRFLRAAGMPLVMGRREGYRFWDLDGRPLLDLHLNGGVFNLGHRNREVIDVLRSALSELDIGNHHFPSTERSMLAKALVEATPGMRYAVFASGGGEAVDLAIKSARRATGRRAVISVTGAYHGHTGLALAVGDEQAAESFLSTSDEVRRVPFNDLAALEGALAAGDVAAVIVESVPATAGFPVPADGYLAGVAQMCRRHDCAYIADEVQTGLGRSGHLWAVQRFGAEPDILVTGKGLSGGVYPIAATLLSERMGGWLDSDGWSHISTFGGAELGCRVAGRVLEITERPQTRNRVSALIEAWSLGLRDLQSRYPGWLLERRQTGLIIGLRFAHPQGGMLMTRLLYDEGVWAIFAGFDRSVLQVKPGLLMTDDEVGFALAALDRACGRAGQG